MLFFPHAGNFRHGTIFAPVCTAARAGAMHAGHHRHIPGTFFAHIRSRRFPGIWRRIYRFSFPHLCVSVSPVDESSGLLFCRYCFLRRTSPRYLSVCRFVRALKVITVILFPPLNIVRPVPLKKTNAAVVFKRKQVRTNAV